MPDRPRRRAEDRTDGSRERDPSREDGTRAPIEVWVIEDNRHLRETVRELVDGEPGMSCALAVERCEDALGRLEAGDVPDVVFVDLGLPGMDGVEGTRRIRSLSPASRIVALTVHEDEDRVFDAIRAGASGYLLKPASAREILGAARTAVEGGSPMNAFIARKVLDAFARDAGPGADYGLTLREREILQLLVEEQTQQEMARRLFVSPHTIDTHLRNIYAKLHVHSRTGAVSKAFRERLL